MKQPKLGDEIWIMRDDRPRLVVIVEEEHIKLLDVSNDLDAFRKTQGNYFARLAEISYKFKVCEIEIRNDFKFMKDIISVFYPVDDVWAPTKEELLEKL